MPAKVRGDGTRRSSAAQGGSPAGALAPGPALSAPPGGLDDKNKLVTAWVLYKDPDWPYAGKYHVTTDGGATYYSRYVNKGDVLPKNLWKFPRSAA